MSKARILVVEDERIVAMALEQGLRHMGYSVAGIATSGEEAEQNVAQTRPDLVLMDIQLRGNTDGIDAAARIRAQFDIPVVYLTAYADDGILQRAKVTEPYAYITKPFEERDLRAAIEMALYKHEMERRLKERERWLATTLSSIGDAVVSADQKGTVTFMNPVAEALTGWKQEDALGQAVTTVLKLTGQEGRVATEGAPAGAHRVGVVGSAGNILVARDGRETPVEHSSAPIKDDQGNITGVVWVLRDISERKQAEEKRRQLEARLRQAQRMEAVGLLAGGVAHEFNNLLTVIQGNAELALRQLPPDHPPAKELAVIQKAARQGAKLTRQLLAFSRRQVLEPQPVDLNRLIAIFCETVGRPLGVELELQLNLAPELKPVLADAAALEQVLLNLALNARDAMPQGGTLTIESAQVTLDEAFCRVHPDAKVGEYVRITVSDTGMGMDHATQERLFEPFFTTKEAGRGTGLGLAMVYGIVKQHDGFIEVHSQPGQGARFEIYLPVHEDSPPAPA